MTFAGQILISRRGAECFGKSRRLSPACGSIKNTCVRIGAHDGVLMVSILNR